MHASSAPSPYKIQSAYLWMRLLGVPFFGLINMLSIILYKDLQINEWQITAILALKPMSALLAPYWSQWIYERPDRVLPNLFWSNLLRYLPFLFLPWLTSPWAIIAAFGLYMLLYRGAVPGWMEIFKRTASSAQHERIVAYGSLIDFCGNAALSLAFGQLLDYDPHAWRWLLPPLALLGILSTGFLYGFHSPEQTPLLETPKNSLLLPWKRSWELMRDSPNFAHFQIGFMLGGAGLIIYQPALPKFFVDTLDLSYTKMFVAVAVCKGIGFACASSFWTALFRKWNIYYFTALVTFLAALFPVLLLAARSHFFYLYAAYILYGMMQAGSELSWHMSGPTFSRHRDSSLHSSTNILTVGIRGCFVPFVGAALLTTTHSAFVMLLGGGLCLLATRHLYLYGKREPHAQASSN